MEEQLISFETVKLAKEKGFIQSTHSYYFEDGEFRQNKITGTNGYYGDEFQYELEEFYDDWNNKWLTKKNGGRCFGCDKSKGYFETFSAPTQSLLAKWIFTKFGFHITIGFDSWNTEKFDYSVNQKGNPEYHYDSDLEFDSQEDALENAMIFILKSQN